MSPAQRGVVDEALETWRTYLLGMRADPGRFEQHVFPVDTLEGGPRKLMSPFLNRYFLRAVQEDVIANRDSVVTYAKLGRILLFGFVHPPRGLLGWKIRLRKGYIAPKTMRMPFALGLWIREQAERCAGSIASMSDKQKVLAQSGMHRAIDENMESFRAMRSDVIHTGADAFLITRRRPPAPDGDAG
jgi:hypothetical protein